MTELDKRVEALSKVLKCKPHEVTYHKEFASYEVSLDHFMVLSKPIEEFNLSEEYLCSRCPHKIAGVEECGYHIYAIDLVNLIWT